LVGLEKGVRKLRGGVGVGPVIGRKTVGGVMAELHLKVKASEKGPGAATERPASRTTSKKKDEKQSPGNP